MSQITLSPEERTGLESEHAESLSYDPDRTFDEYVAARIAPDGKVWRCGACGKTERDRYGERGGWDESCMLNSYLIDDPKASIPSPGATND